MPRLPIALVLLATSWFSWGASARADEPSPVPAAPSHGAFEPGTPSFADLQAKAKLSGRPILIDFSTEWCGWCKKLDADVFPKPEVVKALGAFVCAHLDAEKGEGEELAERYGVTGFPTLVIVDAAGSEVDRIVGYRAPKPFVVEVGRIARGEGTLPALRKALEANPDDFQAAIQLARREFRSDRVAGFKRLQGLLERAQGRDRDATAEAHLALGDAATAADDHDRALDHFEVLLGQFRDTPAAGKAGGSMRALLFDLPAAKAFALLGQLREAARNPVDVVAAEQLAHIWHQQQAAEALKKWGSAAGDDAEDLNLAAWTAFLQQMTPKQAQGWARRAVDLSDRDPAILDTLASLLHQARKYDEAIALEEEAVKKVMDPGMKLEFSINLAMWKAARDVRKAMGAGESEEGSEAPKEAEAPEVPGPK